MRHQIRRSIADTASVLAAHSARAEILQKIQKAEDSLDEDKKKSIISDALENGGKLQPAGFSGSGIHELTEDNDEKKTSKSEKIETVDTNIYCPIIKANDEKRTVLGVVLKPETTDAQGDIYSEDVIEKAAENFLSKYNRATKLGYMHKNFNKKFELLQSFVAPADIVLGNTIVTKGSWVMKVRVIDANVWKLVKDGKIRGFSIGGKAKVVKLSDQKAA